MPSLDPEATRPKDQLSRVSNDTYATLRSWIMTMSLRPGEKLSERWLEEQLGTSRSPVRAALARLEAEGLVSKSGRSCRVTPIDIAEICEACNFREVIEIACIEGACANASETQLTHFRKILKKSSQDAVDSEWLAVAWDFHASIAELSGNRFLRSALEDVTTRLARARWLVMRNETARADAWDHHNQIAERVCAKDASGAGAIMRTHLEMAREQLLSRLRETADETRAVATIIDSAAVEKRRFIGRRETTRRE